MWCSLDVIHIFWDGQDSGISLLIELLDQNTNKHNSSKMLNYSFNTDGDECSFNFVIIQPKRDFSFFPESEKCFGWSQDSISVLRLRSH